MTKRRVKSVIIESAIAKGQYIELRSPLKIKKMENHGKNNIFN